MGPIVKTKSENKRITVEIEKMAKNMYTRTVTIKEDGVSIHLFDDIINENQLMNWIQTHPIN